MKPQRCGTKNGLQNFEFCDLFVGIRPFISAEFQNAALSGGIQRMPQREAHEALRMRILCQPTPLQFAAVAIL